MWTNKNKKINNKKFNNKEQQGNVYNDKKGIQQNKFY